MICYVKNKFFKIKKNVILILKNSNKQSLFCQKY